MTNTALVQARVNPELKRDVDAILEENGLDAATAIRMFYSKVAQVGGIPFEVRSFNAETRAALDEADRIAADPSAKSYGSFAELLADLDND